MTNAPAGRRASRTVPAAPPGTDAPPAPGHPPLRRDAARNLDLILVAARTAFDEEGVDVSVEAIAERAGVGVGTLYRRFPTKEGLIDAVVDEILHAVLSAAEDALRDGSMADGFADFLGAVGRLQLEHAGCLTRLWNDSHTEVRDRIEVAARSLLARAQSVGAVRPDLVYEDVILLFWSMRGVIEATADVSPHAWLRHFDLVLSSVAPGNGPLRHPPLSPEQVHRARATRTPRR